MTSRRRSALSATVLGILLPFAWMSVPARAGAAPGPGPVSVTIQPVSVPGALVDISCPTDALCEVVAAGNNSAVVLPMVNGTPGLPQILPDFYPSAISCSGPSICEIVGRGGGATGAEAVTLVDGQFGVVQHLPGFAVADKVSCSSPGVCDAIAFLMSAPFLQPGPEFVVPVLAGTFGTPVIFPAAFASEAISCFSGQVCELSGALGAGSPNQVGAVVRYDAGAMGPPQAVPGTTLLGGVDCPASEVCWATDGVDAVSVLFGVPGAPTAGTGGDGRSGGAGGSIGCLSVSSCFQAAPGGAGSGGGPLGGGGGTPGLLEAVAGGVPQAGRDVEPMWAISCSRIRCEGLSTAGVVIIVPPDPRVTIMATTCWGVGAACLSVGYAVQGPLSVGVVYDLDSTGNPTSGPVLVPGVWALRAFSCTPILCVAVGFAVVGPFTIGMVVPILNGTPEAAVPVPGTTDLTGVNCGPDFCEAVGLGPASPTGVVGVPILGGVPLPPQPAPAP